jgi:hypothetical protein
MLLRLFVAACFLSMLCACSGPAPHSLEGESDHRIFVTQQLAELEQLDAPEGVTAGDWVELKQSLAAMLRSLPRTVSAPPSSAASKTVLEVGDDSELTWGFYSAGDYDQNGEVNVSDLSPLGARLYDAVPGGEPDSAGAVVDGDSNGEVNPSDLTPIGANLRARVAGYNVYSSLSAADYPAGNTAQSTIDSLGFVPLEDATPPGTGRRRFSFTDAAPVADAYYWVRPTDGEAEGTPSNLAGGPPGGGGGDPVVVIPPTVDNVLMNTQLIVAGGNPAICYDNFSDQTLVYVRALDPAGTTWGAPQVLHTYGDGSEGGSSSPSMISVNGRPAIAFWDVDASFDLGYIRALDANGDAWGPVQFAIVGDEVGDYASLQIVAGNPAIASYDFGNDTAAYVRALDADGAVWGPPVVAISALGMTDNTPDSMSLAVVAGNPAIACLTSNPNTLVYSRAVDGLGAVWGAAVTLDADGGHFAELQVHGGVPVVAYGMLDQGELRFCRAQDASGAAWNTPQVLASGGAGASLSLATIDGLPAISYHDLTAPEQDLRLIRAGNAAGTSWGAPTILDDDGYRGLYSSMLELPGGAAAVAYLEGGFGEPGSVQFLSGF